MRTHHIIAVAIAIAVATTSLGTSSSNEDDGGSGGDAGNTLALALQLSSLANVAGTLSTIDDRDWFYENPADSSAVTCARATLSSEYDTKMRFVVGFGTTGHELDKNSTGGKLAIAAPGYNGAVEEIWGPQMQFPPLRAYSVSLAKVTLPTDLSHLNDGAAGRDATTAEPVAITNGCTLGSLKSAAGDSEDVYTFAGTAGSKIAVSAAAYQDKLTTVVKAPSGTSLATLSSGSMTFLTLPETGTYTMTASQNSSGLLPYAIGLCEPDCKEPPQPCRPGCFELLRE